MHALPILAAAAAAAAMPTPSNSTCAFGVHIIAARGTTNAPGEGPLQKVSGLIGLAVPGSTDAGVVYPAVYWPYAQSLAYGVGNMTEEIRDYTTNCPDTKIVLTGYSQGAQVIGDLLGGGALSVPIQKEWMRNGNHLTLINKWETDEVVIAALQFADPAHVKDKTYNVGTGTHSGVSPLPTQKMKLIVKRFARKNTTLIDEYADVIQSYCDKNDVFCDSGTSAGVHTETVPNHTADAVEFVVKQFFNKS